MKIGAGSRLNKSPEMEIQRPQVDLFFRDFTDISRSFSRPLVLVLLFQINSRLLISHGTFAISGITPFAIARWTWQKKDRPAGILIMWSHAVIRNKEKGAFLAL